jgi:hypothetical protein
VTAQARLSPEGDKLLCVLRGGWASGDGDPDDDQSHDFTFDRDFGELAVRWGRGAAGGVILLRFIPRSPDEVGDVLVDLLARTDVVWRARFSVVDRRHIRQRPL